MLLCICGNEAELESYEQGSTAEYLYSCHLCKVSTGVCKSEQAASELFLLIKLFRSPAVYIKHGIIF